MDYIEHENFKIS